MKNVTTTVGACVALACGSMSVADAQERSVRETTGPFIGFGYNYLDFDDDFGGDAIDAAELRFGWQFTPMWSMSIDANAGFSDRKFSFDSSEEDFNFDDNDDGDLDDVISSEGELSMDYLVGAFANLNFPVSDRLDLSARAGYAFVSLDSTAQTAGGNQVTLNSGTDDGLAYGVGATFDMTEAWNLRAGYTRFDFDEADADSVDLTLQYKF